MLKDGWRSSTQRWVQRLMALSGVLLGAMAWAQTPGGTQPASGAVEVKLHGVPITVTASSVLPDAKSPGRYGPANLLDEDPGTIWAEGVKSTGASEWVELGFPPATKVYAFLVMPGNPKSSKLYLANARPRKALLTLKLDEGRRLDYELEFPKNFPAGGAIYVDYRREFPVQSARLTVISVWPGSKYRDLCLGTFVPVLRGPDDKGGKTFLGMGKDLAPTLSEFVESPSLFYKLLPAQESGVSALLRTYAEVPHTGSLPSPEEELDMIKGSFDEWARYRKLLSQIVAGASLKKELFRLTPAPGGKGYVFDPIGPPKGPDAYSNFRIRWEPIGGEWRVVGVDLKFKEETPDD